MTKPWEEMWKVHVESATTIEGPNGTVAKVAVRYRTEGKWSVPQHADARREAGLIAAAPDMARALSAIVSGTLASIAPVFGALSIDEVVERGQPVSITTKELGDVVAALRKAGVIS